MGKKQAAVDMGVTVQVQQPIYHADASDIVIEGGVVSFTHRKPRTSKMIRRSVPLEKLVYTDNDAIICIAGDAPTDYETIQLVGGVATNDEGLLEGTDSEGKTWNFGSSYVGDVSAETDGDAKAATKSKKSKDDDDEEEAPKKSKKPAKSDDDDGEEEAPKKSKKPSKDDDDDFEEEAPKKSKKPSKDDDDDGEEEAPKKSKKPSKDDDDDGEEEAPKKSNKKPSKDDDFDE